MKITLLGTGTSQGVPVIGCNCAVCRSGDERDKRLRVSILIQHGDINIVVDAGPDFRQQMLRAQVQHLEAILLTHEHNDHAIGLDDIRPFNQRSGQSLDVYALPRVADEVRRRFEYVFSDPIPGLPRIELKPIIPGEDLHIGGLNITPLPVMHGRLPIVAFRIGNFAYLTDVKTVSDETFEKLAGIKYLIVNALHREPHPTHMNLEESLAFIEKLSPEKAWLTHMSHHMGLTAAVERELPPGVHIAYDGLTLEI